MMNNFVKIIIPTLVFVLALGCKKEKPEITENENPCLLDKPVIANFWVGQNMRWYTNLCEPIFHDTIVPRNYLTFNQGAFLYFTADVDCYDELEWIVGFDPNHRYGKQIYVQFFSQDVIGQTIPITLIAKKKANILCYPNDDGVDTIVKNIYFDPIAAEPYGHFLGHNLDEEATDTFTVWIKDVTTFSPIKNDIVGLPKGCNYNCNNTTVYLNRSGGHRITTFCSEASNNGSFFNCPGVFCPHAKGVIEYSSDYDTIKITYQYSSNTSLPNEGNNSIHKVFVGIRQ